MTSNKFDSEELARRLAATMAKDSGDWKEIDPRVQWCFDIMDWEGQEPVSWIGYHAPVAFGTAGGAASFIMRNWTLRRPLSSGIHMTLAGAVAGTLIMHRFREWRSKRAQEDIRVMKHYIMTNPEKFIQPERKKFGDKEVFLDWYPVRN